MAAAAAVSGGVEGKREEVPLLPVIALPVASFPDTISRMDAGVPRKARTARLRAVPSGWWAFRLPVPQPKKEGNPRPQRSRVAPTPPDFDAAAPAAKKPRRCLQCGAVVTPQWRSGPMGQCTLCNACGVRLRAVGALREAEHRPPLAKVRKVVPPPPPQESPAVVSPPGSQIRKERRRALVEEDIYLVRKQPNQEGQPPAEVPYLVKKKKPAKRTWKPRNTGQQCHHCGTTSTPQWREGPMGRHTLCNACGVRYRQGRLLPEYRPAASPTFVASQHACRHREVIALHKRQQPDKEQPAPVGEDGSSLTNQRVDSGSGDAPGSDGDDPYNVVLMRRQLPADKDRYPPTPLHCPLPQQAVEEDPRAGRKNELTAGAATSGCGKGNELMDAPDSVDPLLLNGPSAPLLVDGENFIVD